MFILHLFRLKWYTLYLTINVSFIFQKAEYKEAQALG